MSRATIAAVGLGGNLGDAAATLREALRELDQLPSTRLLRASRLYRTAAWGNTAQPDFINAAALLETRLDARALLDGLLGRSEEHTSELQSLMRISYAVFCLNKKKPKTYGPHTDTIPPGFEPQLTRISLNTTPPR